MAESYKIGPVLADRMIDTIKRVQGTPYKTGQGEAIAYRDTGPDVSFGMFMRLGKTQSTWTKGTTATIYTYDEGTPPNETNPGQPVIEGAVNKFADVQADKWVMLGRTRLGWYLISAEC